MTPFCATREWQDVVERLKTGLDPASNVIEQFAGFSRLEPVDLAAYAPRTAPMDVLLRRERTQRSQVLKQADVVMLLALIPDQYSPAVRETNFRYYEPRTGHGSSLSPAVHALVAARLGDTHLAAQYFQQAATIDLDDTTGDAANGVHIATLGGLWQAAVFGFAGLSLQPDGLRLDPHLPEHWQGLQLSVQWRGRIVRIAVQQRPLTLQVTLQDGDSLTLRLGGLRQDLRRGAVWSCRWEESERRWSEA
ncbi:MAG: glycosyl hydrolase family 65 protein [Dehalococcoidia bacterium]